jgi:Mn2+/Fe2+ NRAMP family transporter
MECHHSAAFSILYLVRNTYALLDKAIKVLMVILALSTIAAMFLAFLNVGYHSQTRFSAPDVWTVSGRGIFDCAHGLDAYSH